VEYAKFCVLMRDGDVIAASDTVRALLKLPLTPHEMALGAVKSIVDATMESAAKQQIQSSNLEPSVSSTSSSAPSTSAAAAAVAASVALRLELYRQLSLKYPDSAHFNLTRISHLQVGS
jgi:hypothetical protein